MILLRCLFLVLLLLPAGKAFACTNPTGVPGEIFFNESYNIPTYCDGTNWIAMVGGDQSGTGTVPEGLGVRSTIQPDTTNFEDVSDIEIVGNYAFVSSYTSDKLVAVDISNPANPTIEANQITGLDRIISSYVVGDYLYTTYKSGPDSILAIIDISEPTNMSVVGSHTRIGDAYGKDGLVVTNNHAFGIRGGALYVWDVSDPANPSFLSTYTAGCFKGQDSVLLDANTMISVNSSFSGMFCVTDISDPNNPSELDRIDDGDTAVNDPNGVALLNSNYAVYTDNDEAKIVVVDISNTSALSVAAELADVAGELASPDRIVIEGDYAFVTNDNDTVTIIDLTSPTNPRVVGSLNDTRNSAGPIAYDNGRLYIGGADNFTTLDIVYGQGDATQIVASGLVGHWRLDETSGTTAFDSSGSGNDATLNNLDFGTNSTQGLIDDALNLTDGPCCGNPAQTTVTAPAVIPTNNGQNFSISAWIYSNSDNGGTFWCVGDDSGTAEFRFFRNGSLYVWANNEGGAVTYPANEFIFGKWAHVVTTYNGSTVEMFINGVSQDICACNTPAVNTFANGDFKIGGCEAAFSETYDFYTDDVRVYDRVLSQDEILELFEARDGIVYNETHRRYEYFDGNQYVSMTPEWAEPNPDPVPAGTYLPNAVEFDGANDYLDADLNLTATKIMTASFWFRRGDSAAPAAYERILNATSGDLSFFIHTNGSLYFRAANSGGTQILRDGVSSVLDTDWHHILVSIDMADVNNSFVYLDDVDYSGSFSIHIDDTLDLGGLKPWGIGAYASGADKFDGALADVWFDTNTHLDLSVEANRRLFIDASGNPVELGADGSIPTGSAPDIFLSGDTADWHTNKGAGGGFTENGELTTATPAPGTLYQGLVGHWKLDETSGTTATDSAGSNDGTLVNGLDAAIDTRPAAVGTGMSFDGIDDKINAWGLDSRTTTFNEFTITAWIYPEAFTGREGVFNFESILFVHNLFSFQYRADHNSGVLCSFTSSDGIDDPPIGEWSFISFGYDGDQCKIYHVDTFYTQDAPDGQLIKNNGGGGEGRFAIGQGNGAYPDSYWQGGIDDVRVYDRALTDSEILTLKNMGAPVGTSTALPQGCPNIGDVCDDGTIYAGDSPDGTIPMFTTPEDLGQYSWNDGSNDWQDSSVGNCGTGASSATAECNEGENNTNELVAADSASTAGFQTHNAAQACYDYVSNGADDWYLPAREELDLLYLNQVAIGNFEQTKFFWSSSETNFNNAVARRFSDGVEFDLTDKANLENVRCVRKGPAPRCANPYGVEGTLMFNTTHNVVQFCDGARWIGIGKYGP